MPGSKKPVIRQSTRQRALNRAKMILADPVEETSRREQTVIERAADVIGDPEKALRWLGTPVRALGYATPISLLHREAGTKEVMDVLAALEQGVW